MVPYAGQNHKRTKVSEELARHLRRHWGRLTQKERHAFAEISGHPYTTLRDIATGRSWIHLDEPVTYKPKPRGQSVTKKRRKSYEDVC